MVRASVLSVCLLQLLLAFGACHQNQNVTATAEAVQIPALLDRVEALQHGKEWDIVQNVYGAQSALLRKEPGNAEARLKLAEIFIQEARVTGEHPHYYPAAMNMLEPVIVAIASKTQPNPGEKDQYFRALSHKASVQLSLHDFKQACQTAEQAIALNPYNAYIYGCLVDALVELGQYQRAVEVCDKMVAIRPDLRSYARVSYLREIHGDVPGAIEAMDMAVKAGYPGSEQTEWARLQLGRLYQTYGQDEAAEQQYTAILQYRPEYPFALAAQASLEAQKGNMAKAEIRLRQAVEIIPEVGFYMDLAKICRKTGREKEALLLISDIEMMLKEDIAAGHNMAMEAAWFHLELTKNLDNALAYAAEEFRIRSENKDVNQLLGAIWLAKGNREKAAGFIRKAKGTGSKDPALTALEVSL